MEVPGPRLSQSSKKQKKSAPKKFLIYHEMELSISKIKTIQTFQEMEFYSSKVKTFLIFQGMELSSLICFLYFRKESSEFEKLKKPFWKKFLYFLKKKRFSYISANGTFLYFLKKVFLICLEMELSSHKNKKI